MREHNSTKPTLLLVAISCFGLLSSACSIGINFVIVNHGSSPIQVKIGLKNDIGEYLRRNTLAKENASYPINAEERWEIVPLKECKIDMNKNEIMLSLNPQETLRVERITNYREEADGAAERFRIKSINILGTNGELVLTGDQARTRFRERESGGREIIYP